MRAPRCGPSGESGLRGLGRLNACGWPMKKWLLKRGPCPLWRIGHTRLGTRPGGLRRDDQPALGDAVGTQVAARIAGRVMQLRPGAPLERLADHWRHELAGAWHPRDNTAGCQRDSRVLGVAFRICAQIPGRWGPRQGVDQGLGAVLDNRRIRRMALPTLAPQGDTALWRHDQFPHRRLQAWPVVFRIAMGETNSRLVTLGYVAATAGKAGRVEMLEALRKTVLGTNGQGQCAAQQVTALRRDLVAGTASFQTSAHRRVDPCTPEPIERLVGTNLRRQRERALGKPQAIEDHPGHRFARADLRLRIRQEASVDPTYQAAVLYHPGHKSQMIHAFAMD